MSIAGIIPYAQIVLSILLITCVLLQQSEAALGSAFDRFLEYGGSTETRFLRDIIQNAEQRRLFL